MNSELIKLLDILRINATNPHRARAFEVAISEITNKISYDIRSDWQRFSADCSARRIVGFGSGLLQRVKEYCESGTIAEVSDIADAAQLCLIKGVGPAQAADWVKRGYKTIPALYAAALKHQIKLTATQRLGILYYRDLQQRIPRRDVSDYCGALIQTLHKSLYKSADIVGSYRRGKPDSGDIDILFCCNTKRDFAPLLSALEAADQTRVHVVSQGDRSITYLFMFGGVMRQCDILLCLPNEYYAALIHFTGSREHCIMLRKRAKERGMLLNQYGLYRRDKPIAVQSEADIYQKLGLEYCQPTNR